MPVSKEAAAWAMVYLLGYENTEPEIVELHRNGYETVAELRTSFLKTNEAKALFDAANPDRNPRSRQVSYAIPPFLLRRPTLSGVTYRFEEPSLSNPVCQMCTSEQMSSPHYAELCRALGLDSTAPHRKVWEFAYILAVLRQKGMLQPGRRGLGFGTGHEMLPSALANAGVYVTATDAPADLDFSNAWAQSAQWTQGLEDLWRPELVSRDDFFTRVTFQPMDMNEISPTLRDYDFNWSACCLEHLGSIRKGLDFIKNNLKTLRPGGVAVHTTEFNLLHDTDTIEASSLCLFRKQDIELVIHEMTAEGHHVEPLNLWPGCDPVDAYVDLPPFSSPHLKLMLGDFVTTSIGISVTKAS